MTHNQLHMVSVFGNLAALVFVVCPGERCTSIYRGHGDMPVIGVYFWNPSPNMVSILDYLLNFRRNRMFILKLLFLRYYCLKTIKPIKQLNYHCSRIIALTYIPKQGMDLGSTSRELLIKSRNQNIFRYLK